uniref:Uncharacterized protein n=1 Tax=Arundo donax TaxID=35708 RepID=A0A0A9BCF2_ARUDO
MYRPLLFGSFYLGIL